MKPLHQILAVIGKIEGHECPALDDAFLKQFGIKRLTGLRDTCETALDRAQFDAGHIVCNDSAMRDFVCEKDGLQFGVFIYAGVWALGDDVLYQGHLLYSHPGAINDAGAFDWEVTYKGIESTEVQDTDAPINKKLEQLQIIGNLVTELRSLDQPNKVLTGVRVARGEHGWRVTLFHDRTNDNKNHPFSEHDNIVLRFSCIKQDKPGNDCTYCYPSLMGDTTYHSMETNSMREALKNEPEAEILYRYYDTIVAYNCEYIVWFDDSFMYE